MPPRTAADPSLDSREGDDHRAEGDALAGSAGAARGPEAAESLLDTVRGAPPDALEPLAVPALVARERLPEGALAAVPELQPALLQKSPALSEISPSVRGLPAQATRPAMDLAAYLAAKARGGDGS